MFINALTMMLRHLRRHPGYAALNIGGLAVGIACCLLLVLYINHELSYDRSFEYAGRIYRPTDVMAGQETPTVSIPGQWLPVLIDNLPEIERAVRIGRTDRLTPLIAFEDKRFYEKAVFHADSSFFQIFDYEFVEGRAADALARPNSVVITEAKARIYFGDQPALGQTLTYNQTRILTVTGVVKPPDTHLAFDMLLKNTPPLSPGAYMPMYLLLRPGAAPEEVERKMTDVLKARYGEGFYGRTFRLEPRLQALTDIHLDARVQGDIGPNGNMAYIYLLATGAGLILIVACINFMNMITAQYLRRTAETGIRKALGASRYQLSRQFLGETCGITTLALITALIIVELALPAFNILAGKQLMMDYWYGGMAPIVLLILVFVIGLLSGGYPAFFLSAFQPVEVLKGRIAPGIRMISFRRMLIVVQFTISVVMLIGTGVISGQLDYVRRERLGFDRDRLVAITSRDAEINRQSAAVKTELLRHPAIRAVSFVQGYPGRLATAFQYTMPGNQPETRLMSAFGADHDFIETMGIEVAEGRGFSEAYGDEALSFILNETAVTALGWETPIGREIGVTYLKRMGTVVGVVKDFHITSLHQPVEPVVIQVMPPDFFTHMIVRIEGDNLPGAMTHIEETWAGFSSAYPFEYAFLNEVFNELYQSDVHLGRVFGYFTVLGMLVACIGLFGLASFSVERRVREIGIRKVLGASVSGLVVLLARDFALLITIACLLAMPIAYIVMNQWLQTFAYRIDIEADVFVSAAMLTLSIALLTVGYHAFRAAVADPTDTLRHE